MKKLLVVLLVLGMLLGACAPKAAPVVDDSNRAYQNGKPFRFVHPNKQHPIVRIMMLGFFEACEDLDVDCEDAGVNMADTNEVIQKGEESISLGSSGVVYTLDKVFFENSKQILAADIPVVSIHLPMTDDLSEYATAWIATDTTDYGMRAGYAMAEATECAGTIAITQSRFNEIENPVSEAFAKAVLEKCPNVTVLPVEEEGFDTIMAIDKAASILSAHPDTVGALSTTGAGSTTWGQALKDLGKEPGEVKVISMDYSRENLDWVKDGWVMALVGQPLYEETYAAVELLVKIIRGEEVDYANPLPAPLIFVDDIDTYYGYADRVDERFGE